MRNSALRLLLLDEIMPATSQLGKILHDTEGVIRKDSETIIGVTSHTSTHTLWKQLALSIF